MSLGEESWGPLYWALQTLMLVVSQISGIGAVVVAGEGLDHQFQEKKKRTWHREKYLFQIHFTRT